MAFSLPLAHLNGKVDGVAHRAKCMNTVAKLFDSLFSKMAQMKPGLIPIENDLARVAPQDNVIRPSRRMNSRLPSRQAVLLNKF